MDVYDNASACFCLLRCQPDIIYHIGSQTQKIPRDLRPPKAYNKTFLAHNLYSTDRINYHYLLRYSRCICKCNSLYVNIMKEKTFGIIIVAVLAICLALTIAHVAWSVYAYDHCSIIYFISKELW